MTVCVLHASLPAKADDRMPIDSVRAAQSASEFPVPDDTPQEGRNQLAIDAGFLMASVSYARNTGGAWFFGGGAGVSGDFLGYMVFAGRHYTPRPPAAPVIPEVCLMEFSLYV